MKYLIQSTERMLNGSLAMFWKQSRYGYTANIMEAGKFDEADARKIVDDAMGKELAYSFEYVCSESEIVDVQGFGRIDAVKVQNLDRNAAAIKYKQ